MKGVDISAYQTGIDWDAMKAAGIEFCIIKLGEHSTLDEAFVGHINDAVSAGMKVGVYYYSHAQSTDAAQQEASWVDSMIKTYLNGQCPQMGIWYDMEDPSIANSGADITVLCQTFINGLGGYAYVGVYASYDWLTNKINTSSLECGLWCAQYNSQCDFQSPNLRLWQYSDSLTIGGIAFDADETVS